MECYYLEARTSDTISLYQVQTPQIETHNNQDSSQRVVTGLGYWLTMKGEGYTNILKAIVSKVLN